MCVNALTTIPHLLVEGSMDFLQPHGVRVKFRFFSSSGIGDVEGL